MFSFCTKLYGLYPRSLSITNSYTFNKLETLLLVSCMKNKNSGLSFNPEFALKQLLWKRDDENPCLRGSGFCLLYLISVCLCVDLHMYIYSICDKMHFWKYALLQRIKQHFSNFKISEHQYNKKQKLCY